jgi:1-acyl-sn-glycerol-3-phosphate acyltransferase
MIDIGQNTLGVRLLRGILLFCMRILFRIEHNGMEWIPRNGPLIIAANHVTYFDPFWIAVRMTRKVHFMAWDKIFTFPPAGWLFHWLGAFPVNLGSPEYSAFKAALRILKNEEALMIFPEGGRSPDGVLMEFKDGASRLALRTGAAIVPVVVHGGERVWSSRMILPRPGKVRVEYLEPIYPCPGELDCDEADLTDRIRRRILENQSTRRTNPNCPS